MQFFKMNKNNEYWKNWLLPFLIIKWEITITTRPLSQWRPWLSPFWKMIGEPYNNVKIAYSLQPSNPRTCLYRRTLRFFLETFRGSRGRVSTQKVVTAFKLSCKYSASLLFLKWAQWVSDHHYFRSKKKLGNDWLMKACQLHKTLVSR